MLQSQLVYEEVGVVRLGQLMAMPSEELSTSVALVLQHMINSITGVKKFQEELEKFHEMRRQGDHARRPQFQLGE